MLDRIGWQKVSADAAVAASGAPVAVYGVTIVSGAGGAGTVNLYDGTSTGGTQIYTQEGTTNEGQTFPFQRGLVFPNGCFVDIDANTSYATVWFEKI